MPTRPLMGWVVASLWLGIAAGTVILIADLLYLEAVLAWRESDLTGTEVEPLFGWGWIRSYYEIITITGAIIFYLVAIILPLLLLNRISAALHARGVPVKMTPRWLVVWFFIPIANLWKPYQGVRELWIASDPAATGGQGAPTLLKIWWALWLIPLLFSVLALISLFDQSIAPDDADGGYGLINTLLAISTGITDIGFFIAFIFVLRRLEERLQHGSALTEVFR